MVPIGAVDTKYSSHRHWTSCPVSVIAAFIKRVDQLTGGGSAKSHWTGNRSARGWAGWKMLTPEKVSTGQDGQSYCGRCEKPFEPLLAETYCPVCIAFA